MKPILYKGQRVDTKDWIWCDSIIKAGSKIYFVLLAGSQISCIPLNEVCFEIIPETLLIIQI